MWFDALWLPFVKCLFLRILSLVLISLWEKPVKKKLIKSHEAFIHVSQSQCFRESCALSLNVRKGSNVCLNTTTILKSYKVIIQ